MEKEQKKHATGTPIKPKGFAIGGHVFGYEELAGFTAETVRKRLATKGVNVTTKLAKAFAEHHNKKGA